MVIGLTGGIGSGKSTAAGILNQLGAHIIYSDKVNSKVLNQTQVINKIKKAFPSYVDNGQILRSQLKNYIFSCPSAKKILEDITHPQILKNIKKEIALAKTSDVVIEVPLLFESGFNSLCDITLCITAPDNVKAERTAKRDNISVELAYKILNSQLGEDERAKKCDYVIQNHNLSDLQASLIDFWKKIH